MKLINIYLLILVITCMGCTKNFESFNSNEAGLSKDQEEYDYNRYGIPLRIIQQGIYFNYDWGKGKNWPFQMMQNLGADMFSGYMHDFVPFEAGLSNSVYNLNNTWNAALWENTYGYILTEVKKSEDLTEEIYPMLFAITKILKVEVMHRVSDVYGPIIYTHFGSTLTDLYPDSQEEAYEAFFNDLEKAICTLKMEKDHEFFEKFDLLMPAGQKDIKQWIRFANSLRLRLAMRIAMVDPVLAKRQALAALDPNAGGVIEVANGLVAVSTNGTGYINPLGVINRTWGEVAMNANMESILTGYKDPRLPFFFNTATDSVYEGKYKGIRQGTGFNHMNYRNHSSSTVTENTDAILMSAAEVWFLRAEAALRGWTAESVAHCYEQGITESFVQWGARGVTNYLKSDETANDYIDAFDAFYNIKAQCQVSPQWNETASNEIKLEKIITQKWIACYPDGCEAWAEQRRTGYPRLFPVLVNKSNGDIDTQTMIRRLNFPIIMKAAYPSQYIVLCEKLNGADHGGTRLWWDTGKNF
jgi:hypothetical protein